MKKINFARHKNTIYIAVVASIVLLLVCFVMIYTKGNIAKNNVFAGTNEVASLDAQKFQHYITIELKREIYDPENGLRYEPITGLQIDNSDYKRVCVTDANGRAVYGYNDSDLNDKGELIVYLKGHLWENSAQYLCDTPLTVETDKPVFTKSYYDWEAYYKYGPYREPPR